MKFKEWKDTRWNQVKQDVDREIKKLFKITDLPFSLLWDVEGWLSELNNFDLMYSEDYCTTFIYNEVYEYCANNLLKYKKLEDFFEDGFGEVDKEEMKHSYSVGGFDTINQDLQTGALNNEHATSNKNKISNLEILEKIKSNTLLDKNKFLNKIKECLIIIW